MITQFRHILTTEKLLAPRDTIIVGVSGGADSLCLLHLLLEIQEELQLTIVVAHVNYGVRKTALRDQRIVEEFAKQHNLTLITKKLHFTPGRKKNFEDWARQERYKFFAALAKKHKAQRIAVAHNKNDQAETVLMHFLRGTGLPGLSGMTVREGMLIRPLLHVTRQEIVAELKKHKIRFAVDETNRDKKFFRNRLRHELLPLLTKKYNPNIIDALARTSSTAQQLQDYLAAEAEAFINMYGTRRGTRLRFPRTAWEATPDALLHEVITLTCSMRSGRVEKLSNPHFAQVLAIFRPWRSGLSKELPAGLKITTEHDTITVQEQ